MAKVNANLADAKTSYENIEPGSYEMKLVSCEYDPKEDRYDIKSVVDEMGNDHYNKPVYDRLYMQKKDGSGPNKFSEAQLRRYFEAILGWNEDSDWSEADTDMLVNGRFRGEVIIETYITKEDKAEAERTGNPPEKNGSSNRFKKNGILPL